jgi:hypothetical protein
MRSLALAAAIALVPATAFAGSISTISGNADGAGSIISFGQPQPVATAPAAPRLAPGEELVQIRRVDGKTKIYRTEAWLGGSPVTYVTAATDADLAALKSRGIDVASNAVQALRPAGPALAKDMTAVASANIDRQAKTGALTVGPAPAEPFDPAHLTLRLKLADAD